LSEERIGAAIIGTGFIGTVHLDALRRLGVEVRGVLGSDAARGETRAAALRVPRAYASLDELLADPGVAVVHVTSPNQLHFPQVMRLLDAGRHMVCEKPLAMTSTQSAEMVERAQASGLVAAVCYNTRFYPLSQHAHRMVADGALGDVRLVTGHYLQDWLSRETDWNWRLEPEAGGALRAVGDIGTHWADLTSFITGLRPSAVLAELAIFLPERQRPTGPTETFSRAAGATERRRVETEDAGLILLRYPNGARGSLTVSQVSPGRKNAMSWDIAGSEVSASWHSETPDHLWIGHRNERGRRGGSQPPRRPRGGLRRYVSGAVPSGLRGRGRRRALAGLDLCRLRGWPPRDALLRRRAGERARRALDRPAAGRLKRERTHEARDPDGAVPGREPRRRRGLGLL
jgi:predicted dehydrogenase